LPAEISHQLPGIAQGAAIDAHNFVVGPQSGPAGHALAFDGGHNQAFIALTFDLEPQSLGALAPSVVILRAPPIIGWLNRLLAGSPLRRTAFCGFAFGWLPLAWLTSSFARTIQRLALSGSGLFRLPDLRPGLRLRGQLGQRQGNAHHRDAAD
jgi:hypothetical protein